MPPPKAIKGAPKQRPYEPSDWEEADAEAIKALANGTAADFQQIRAINFIVNVLAGTYDMSYRPGDQYDTAFAEGKRHVGAQIVKLVNLNTRLIDQRKRAQ